jgi:signal transduction histidine kinase
MKLISRYNRIYLPIIIIVFFISIIVGYFFIKKILLDELDESIDTIRNKIEWYVKANNKLPEIQLFPKEVVVFEKINNSIADTGFSTITVQAHEPVKQRSFRKLIFLLSLQKEIYKTTITSQVEGTKHLTKLMFYITMITIFVIILISFLLNRLILSKLWLPFYESLQILKDFKIDNPKPLLFPKTSTDEFNFMIKSLQSATKKETETYQSLKEFTENASHEIQTPLAIIRTKLDVLIQNDNFSERESETGKTLYSAIDKLSKLSQSLLLITKIDNHNFESKTKIDLKNKVEDKIMQFQELWQMNNIEVTANTQTAQIDINENLVDILLNNLLSNATKHNIENGKIHIETRANYLCVSNTGLSNSLDNEKIFKRFYKYTQHSESNGLGLSIIKQICDVSGINISYTFTENTHSFILSW